MRGGFKKGLKVTVKGVPIFEKKTVKNKDKRTSLTNPPKLFLHENVSARRFKGI